MSPPKPPGPTLSAKGAAEQAARRARQAEALRANLSKRKAQVRARRDGAAPTGAAGPKDAPSEP